MKVIEKELDELLETRIAIFEAETEKHIKDSIVWEIADGFDLFIEIEGEAIVLRDYQDDEYCHYLGREVKSVLKELNKFNEYFNGWDWYSDFEFYTE